MQTDLFTPDAIEALLIALRDQLTKAKHAASLAHDYRAFDTPFSATSDLIKIEVEINQAMRLFNAIMTLHRLTHQDPE